MRKKINSGDVHYVDMHLSILPQQVRYGFFGKVDYAVVEAVDVTPGGGVVLSSSVGAANTYMRMADKILIEINSHHPQGLLGMHDIFEPQDPRRAPNSMSIVRATASVRQSAWSTQRRSPVS